MKVLQFQFAQVNQWLYQRQLHILEDAYQGAQAIKALEDHYFESQKIEHRPHFSKTVTDYVQSMRDRHLFNIRVNLAQFRLNSFLLTRSGPHAAAAANLSESPSLTSLDERTEVLAKLKLIDAVISKYRESEQDDLEQRVAPASPLVPPPSSREGTLDKQTTDVAKIVDPPAIATSEYSASPNRFGLFGRRFSLRRPADPQYEQKVVQELRLRRKQDKMAIRWLAILLLVPLLVAILSKTLIFNPLLGSYGDRNPTRIELNAEMEEEFLARINQFKEELEIREVLGLIPDLSPEVKQQQMDEKVTELWQESRNEALNGAKNMLADGVALLAFAGLVYFNRDRVRVIRSFSNRTFMSLTDPAKVFLFILVTDIFVGFHSAEGWEVLLEGIARHFGFPESKAAINTFIATVPVILDAGIKFWIFTYLTRYSPSASAIYERMNT